MKRLFILLPLLCITFAYSANLYKKRIKLDYESVEVKLSKDCASIINMSDLLVFEKQLNKMPKPIPRIKFIQSDETLGTTFKDRIKKSIDMNIESEESGIFQIFIAYEPGQTYGLGNTIGKVFASNTGLILLNDKRIAEAYDYHKGFVTNLIIHEILHIYGLDHANGLGNIIKNIPVMSLGKSGPIGMSFDDRAGLLENYNAKTKMSSVSLNTNGNVVALVGKKSQAKNAIDGSVTFTHVPSGKYKLFVDFVQIRKLVVK